MSNSHRGIQNPLPHLQILSSEDIKSCVGSKVIPSINTADIPTSLTLNYPKLNLLKQDVGYVPSPIEKLNSFSDIISPQNVHTVINMSLEKELERDVRKSLHTMSDHDDIFDESSIHKDAGKPGLQSGFDLKEHDSLLNDNPPADAGEQLNKKMCILCHNSQQVHNTIIETEASKSIPNVGEYDLIYPCLCRIRTHRECMKSYILLKKISNCERCKTKYAACGKTMKEINIPRITFWTMALTAIMSLAIVISGVALMASSFAGPNAALAAAGIILIIIGVLGLAYLVWKKYFSKKIVDLAIYCKQTEIARHSDFSEYRLRNFIEDEESKRNSRILKRSRKILNLTDVTEFETFIKMTTPRIDNKVEKVAHHERNGSSSNFLLSDQSKHKDNEEEDFKKKTRKEIFIAPTTEFGKSETTVPDYPSSVNEHSSKLKGAAAAISQIRVTNSHPSKHVDIRKNLPRPLRPENRRGVGSQSERTVIDPTQQVQSSRPMRGPPKDPQSATSIGNFHGFSAREHVDSQDLLSLGLPKRGS